MTATYTTAVEAFAFVVFTVAAGLFVSLPVRDGGRFDAVSKWLLVAVGAASAFASLSNVLEHAGATSALDPFEDYIEILLPTAIVYAAYAIAFRHRENDLFQAHRALERSHAFVMDLVDATPAGIIVLDSAGRIAFANESARECLDLAECEDGEDHPAWVVRDERYAARQPRPDFSGFLEGKPLRQVPVTVEWPSGWRRRLSLNVVPMEDSRGAGGAIAAFVDRSV